MRTNIKLSFSEKTHGGAPAAIHLTPYQTLRRSVMACLLWEDSFYESGDSIADRIKTLATQVSANELSSLALEARSAMHLRHVPLLLCVYLARYHGGDIVKRTLAEVIQRPDELTEFLSLYWSEGRCPLSKQVKLGLAAAFTKFDAYALAKYNRDAAIKLRDVLFLTHAKPKDAEQAAVWRQLVEGTLASPDTWEVALSAGTDKKETFERLLREHKLGYLALLRNLRTMASVGVDTDLIKEAILARRGADRVLPFRFIAAVRACPQLEPALDTALLKNLAESTSLSGKTVVLVDVSGSMRGPLSAKSDLTRTDAACALASIIPGDVRTISFSNFVVEVPPRKGMAGIDAILNSQAHGCTDLAGAVAFVNSLPHDRLIVITDEQSTSYSRTPDPVVQFAYMINVASYKQGVGYGKWVHLDGFSENVLKWIVEYEAANSI